nr:hypothetical protein [Tanacetum cinerariifolium]
MALLGIANVDSQECQMCQEHTSRRIIDFVRVSGIYPTCVDRTKILEETLHITFLDNKPNVAGSGPTWLFDIDTLTKSMNYKPVVTGNQSNGSAGKARVETVPDKDYILLPLWTQDPVFFSSSKDYPGDGFKPSGEEEKKDAEDLGNKDIEVLNNVVDENIVYRCADDLNMPNLEVIVYSDDDEDVGVEVVMTNLDTNIPVGPFPTTKIHKDHMVEQMIRNIHSAPQNRRMTKSVTDHDGKRAIGTKWIYVNKKDERGIVMDVKSAFLYGKIEEEVYVYQTLRFEDLEFPDRVYKLKKHYMVYIKLLELASTPMETSNPLMKDENAEDVDVYLYRSMIGSLMYLTSSRPDIMFDVCACA